MSTQRGIRAVPGLPDPDVYGYVEFFDGLTAHRLTIGVHYDGELPAEGDIWLSPNGRVLRHRFDGPRESTEEERAAVGWTW